MDWIRHILRLVVSFLLQILIVSNLQLLGVCSPFVYIVFLLMMPTTLPKWADLLIGAALGFTMDIFCNSLGIHMAACTMICYLRRPIIQNLLMDYDRLTGEINSSSLGLQNFIKYVIVLVSIHHSMVFLLNAWSLGHLWWTILTIMVSALFSIGMILGYDYIRK